MALSEEEKETVIQFDEGCHVAQIYTASWDVARSMKRAGYQPTKKVQGAWWFEVPIQALSLQGEKQSLHFG
ncbi:hypothetical protein GCM10011571_08800 [Marinithermofilum abyssi]|jgi:hypothetical protein|uniref:Uncharacterized protein n=1 Tax=Marinithermofilum abyssi TaxID=1571185 RepID=A0A8J2VDF4_9BACL|nr:hypothetical protein [Marinithermofilum abyssi]GGE09747.1 hypothetical protein GCM10011571_08800 [Marinithermofilum abyssi]